jgi:hypothetical protein
MCKALLPVLGGMSLSPDDIRQPNGHGIHQLLQVHTHEASILLLCTEIVTASCTKISESMLTIFHHPKAKHFVFYSELSCKENKIASLQASFLSQECLPYKKYFP